MQNLPTSSPLNKVPLKWRIERLDISADHGMGLGPLDDLTDNSMRLSLSRFEGEFRGLGAR